MSREIKFELIGRNVQFNEIVREVVNLQALIDGNFNRSTISSFFDTNNGNCEFIAARQSTGLKDKNGTEIYEGDIVLTPYGRYKWNANEEEDESKVLDMIPSRVIQNTMGWTLIPEMGKKKASQRIKRRHYMFTTHYNESEVIGNIYQNPELLKSST